MPRKTKKTASKKKTTQKAVNPFKKHAIAEPVVEESDEEQIEEQVEPSSAKSPYDESTEVSATEAPEQVETTADSETSSEEPKKDEWVIHHIGEQTGVFSEEVCGEILKHLKSLDLVTDEQIEQIQETMIKEGVCFGEVVVQQGFLSEDELGQAVAAYFHCTYARFKNTQIPPDTISILPKEVSQKSGAVVFEDSPDYIKVAMVNPEDLHFIHLLEKKIGKNVEVHYTTPSQINEAIKSYPSEFENKLDVLMARASQDISHLENLDSVSQIFDSMVLLAFQRGASDVHIEPFEDEIRVRFRVDGVLNTITTLPIKFQETIINHIKVLAKLRIDTHNASQDGRFHVTYEETTINFRVSIMPTHYGEKAVLRLLTSETQEWTLAELGYRENDQNVIEKGISKTNGMVLVCGPTGSGKTTTLYAILKELNKEGVNISTIEDPIEYGLPGIMQSQVNPRTNITYAEGLKSLMRQDPDILMIGEVRDHETGDIAVNSALTGHLVFSTLHTNNASLAPLRLLQMGVDPYLITTTVELIVAQRLIRKICTNCLTSYTLSKDDIDKMKDQFGLDEEQRKIFDNYFGKEGKSRLFKGGGCDKCGNTGFHGRSVIAEVLKMKDNIRDLIKEKKSESIIQEAAKQNGMTTMFEDGLSKVAEGMTTLEEVLRVINQ